jgi:hemerythrin
MEKVQWNDSLSVGVKLIDEQHKMLIQRLNEISKAIDSRQGPREIVRTLTFLIEYTHFHFSTEEKHMKANSYPGLEHHMAQHEEFKVTLANLENDVVEEGATYILADSLDTFLVNWLIKHISGVDLEFGMFLQNNGITINEEA